LKEIYIFDIVIKTSLLPVELKILKRVGEGSKKLTWGMLTHYFWNNLGWWWGWGVGGVGGWGVGVDEEMFLFASSMLQYISG
jgi:hypothetical protein